MEKKSKKSLIIGLTSLFLVMLILLGLTYAYYRTRIIGNNSNEPSISVQSKKMEVVYEDGNAVLSSEGLIEPGFTATKQFSVQNTGDETTTFSIFLDNVINEFNKGINERGEYNDWKYYLYSGTTVSESNLIKEGEITTESTQYLLESVIINVSETKQYLLKVEYKHLEDVDQSLDMGSKFSIRVNIGDEYKVEYTWDKAPSGTLLYALKNNQPTGTEETTPGKAASKSNEARILATEDDYGKSYVYRGNVQNNYVNFAGMCWRIVRVEGDGSVKLILEDRNEQCNDKAGNDLNNNGTYYTGNWSDGITYTFGYVFGYDNNVRADFINYTGGLADSFKNFQTTKLSLSDLDKLKIDEWCYDNQVITIDDKGNEYYGAYTRIETNKVPSLKCTGTKLTKFADETDMYVGTLTADEMSFAGALNTTNYNYYLMNTYAKDNSLFWWSLSPYSFNAYDCIDLAFILGDMFGTGNLSGDNVLGVGSYSRPAVSLKSGSVITDGVGTLENPYIIG